MDNPISPTAVPPQQLQVTGLDWVGHLPGAQVQTLAVQGDYAYVGLGTHMAVIDLSDPGQPRRVGYTVLPEPILDLAFSGSYAFVAAGAGGIYVVDISNPAGPALIHSFDDLAPVSRLAVNRDHLYVSSYALHVLDVSDPRTPREMGAFTPPDPRRPVGELVGVKGDLAYTVFYSASEKLGGLRVFDVATPGEPVEIGTFLMDARADQAAVSAHHAFLLSGQGVPRLILLDLTDPRQPVEVSSPPALPGSAYRLAVREETLLLVDPGAVEGTGRLQLFDISDPLAPVLQGRLEGIPLPVVQVVGDGSYGYVATAASLLTVKVTDPPGLVGVASFEFDILPGEGEELAIAGDHAYIAARQAGLQVVDVSTPSTPRLVAGHETLGPAWDIALAPPYAYVAVEHAGLRVFDVSDAGQLVEVGSYDLPGAQEFFHGVVTLRDRAFVADGGLQNTGLRILDVSDPSQPTEIGFLPLVGADSAPLPPRAEDVALLDADHVVLAGGTAGLRVVDVSDPTRPIEVGVYATPGRADNLVVSGQHVYLIDGDLRIVDVSEPAMPALIGFHDLVNGAATPHVAVEGGYAYVTDRGIQILDVTQPGALTVAARRSHPSGSVAVSGRTVYVVGDGLFILHVRR